MDDEKPFTNHQEIYLEKEYIKKETFYEYQKKQDERLDKHDIEFAKTLLIFRIIAIAITSVCIPLAFMLLGSLMGN